MQRTVIGAVFACQSGGVGWGLGGRDAVTVLIESSFDPWLADKEKVDLALVAGC